MSIVIDVNTMPSVFCASTSDHSDFRPVLEWILFGNGKVVVGGKTFMVELKRLPRYMRVLENLKAIGKAGFYTDPAIDSREQWVAEIEPRANFDDKHIVALIGHLKVRLFCSRDGRSFPFINDTRFYDSSTDRPAIYTNSKHAPQTSLLCNDNLTPGLGPYRTVDRAVADRILASLPS